MGSSLRDVVRISILVAMVVAAAILVGTVNPTGRSDETPNASSVVRILAYALHSTISINGDPDFASQALAEGWPGDGSSANPYVISGYEIDGKDYKAGVVIGNTTVNFVLRDCLIHDSVQAGVHLYNTQNGVVTNNSLVGNTPYGIYLSGSDNNRLDNNTCTGSGSGLSIYNSEYNEVADNLFHNNGVAVSLSYADHNSVLRNNVTGTGGGISMGASSYNTVSGNNCSYRSGSGIVVGGGVVTSVGNLIADNLAVHNSQNGLYLNQASNKVARNNFSFNVASGIRSEMTSSGHNISNNTCSGNGAYGIFLDSPIGAKVNDNLCTANVQSGIKLGLLYTKMAGQASRNTCVLNGGDGICVQAASLDRFGWYTFDRNNCSKNGLNGLYLLFADGNRITNGTFEGNGMNGIVLAGSLSNTVSWNDCSGNQGSGILLERIVAHETWCPDYNVISENTIQGNIGVGISMASGKEIEIRANSISDNSEGLNIYSCSYAAVDGNDFQGNNRLAVDIENSVYTTLRNNVMTGEGVRLSGIAIQFWALQDIDGSNLVNGKPVYYLSGGVGDLVPSGLGQVILADCAFMVVENQTLCETSIGVQIGYCENITVQYNTIWGNLNGIVIVSSNCDSVFRNYLSLNTGWGIEIQSGVLNRVWNNTFISNNGAGVLYDANHIQAADFGTSNHWNISGTGNWWGDWQSPDGNVDGIVDVPYAIDGSAGSEDCYPLTDPYEPIPELPLALVAMLLAVLVAGIMSLRRHQ